MLLLGLERGFKTITIGILTALILLAGCPSSDDNGTENGGNGTTSHTVAFKIDGGISQPDAASVVSGQKVSEPSAVRDGYSLSKWYTDVSYTSPYDFETQVSSDITLYAQWGHYIIFDIDGTPENEVKVFVAEGAAVSAEDIPVPFKSGNFLAGWKDRHDAEIDLDNFTPGSDLALYPVWVDKSLTLDNPSITARTAATLTFTATSGGSETASYTILSLTAPDTAVAGAIEIGDDDKSLTVRDSVSAGDSGTYKVDASVDKTSLSTEFELTVSRRDLSDVPVSVSDDAGKTSAVPLTEGNSDTLAFDGPAGLVEGTDYTVTLEAPSGVTNKLTLADGVITIPDTVLVADSGFYTVKAEGKGDYTGTASIAFDLSVSSEGAAELSTAVASLTVPTVAATAYTETLFGAVTVIPAGTAAPVRGTDYTLSIENAYGDKVGEDKISIDSGNEIAVSDQITVSDGGNFAVVATGIGDYKGRVVQGFVLTVDPRSLTGASLVLNNGSWSMTAYTGGTFPLAVTDADGRALEYSDGYTVEIKDSGGSTPAKITVDPEGRVAVADTIASGDAGDYTVTVTGTGNYGGTADAAFALTVGKASIAYAEIILTPSAITAEAFQSKGLQVSVTAGGRTLNADTDYTLKLTDSGGADADTGKFSVIGKTIETTGSIGVSDSGDYTVAIDAKPEGSYTGSSSKIFTLTVNAKPLSSAAAGITLSGSSVSRTENDPAGSIAISGLGGLTKDTDYTLSIVPPVGVTANKLTINTDGEVSIPDTVLPDDTGTYTVKAAGTGSYDGELTAQLELTVSRAAAAPLADDNFAMTVPGFAAALVDGGTGTVAVTSDTPLTVGTDYTLSVKNSDGALSDKITVNLDTAAAVHDVVVSGEITEADAGTYTIVATGKGGYKGTAEQTFDLTVNKKSIAGAAVTVTPGEAAEVLTGGVFASTAVSLGGTDLVYNTDYTLGIKKSNGDPVDSARITLDLETGRYVASNQIAITDAGDYIIAATGIGNYEGTQDSPSFALTVNKADLGTAAVSFSSAETDINTAKDITVTVKLGARTLMIGEDYTLAVQKDGSPVDGNKFTLNGNTISITDQIESTDAGNYQITAAAVAAGSYEGTAAATWTLSVNARDIGLLSPVITLNSQEVTPGAAKTLAVTVKVGETVLIAGTDYTLSLPASPSGASNAVSIVNNQVDVAAGAAVGDAGIYRLRVSGTGNYAGSADKEFYLTVAREDISGETLNVPAAHTATALEAEVIDSVISLSALTAGTDYVLSITDADGNTPDSGKIFINADRKIEIGGQIATGDAKIYKISARGTGAYEGTVTSDFTLSVNQKTPELPVLIASAPYLERGEVNSVAYTWEGGIEPADVVYSLANPPAGFTIVAVGGIKVASDVTPGTYTLNVEARVDEVLEGSGRIPFQVAYVLSFTYPDTLGYVGRLSEIAPKLTGVDSVDLTSRMIWEIANAPEGVSINEGTGVITVDPASATAEVAEYTVAAHITGDTNAPIISADGTLTAAATFSLRVGAAEFAPPVDADGDGLKEITSAYQLHWMRYDLDGEYELKNDIIFPATGPVSVPNPNDPTNDITIDYENFDPVGDNTTPFTGVLEGNLYKIEGLKIARPGEDYIGLFGRLLDATVSNLLIVHNGIEGKSYVGALSGRADNSVMESVGVEALSDTVAVKADGNSNYLGGITGFMKGGTLKGYAEGKVGSASNYVGGLVGRKEGDAKITGYFSGTVAGTNYVGGIMGSSRIGGGEVAGYALGYVRSSAQNAGGAVGFGDLSSAQVYARNSIERTDGDLTTFGYVGGDITGLPGICYYSASESKLIGVEDASGFSGSPMYMNGTVTPTAQADFEGFDFTNRTWVWLGDGRWPALDIGPVKPAEDQPTERVGEAVHTKFSPGAPPKNADGVYQVSTWEHLQWMNNDLSADYVLLNDITLPGEIELGVNGWTPIGADSGFSGSFDGGGHTVSNLWLANPPGADLRDRGLFGRLSGADIRDLMIDIGDQGIAGEYYVGGLAGRAVSSAIEKVGVVGAGSVNAVTNFAGGIVGRLESGSLTRSFSTVDVKGEAFVGGLAGSLTDSEVTGYAEGNVTASSRVAGGLAGYMNGGSLIGYATGDVSEGYNTGGLVGQMTGNSAATGYATGKVSGTPHTSGTAGVGGFAGIVVSGATATGYARGSVTRSSGEQLTLGRLAGAVSEGTVTGYFSDAESQLLNENSEPLTGAAGEDGTSITMAPGITQTDFANLNFGTAVGEWTWVADGRWPALNLGFGAFAAADGAAPADQPTGPLTE